MYNNKSAKDLLSQFPKRMAEGGEATKEPEAAAVGGTPAEWTAPAIEPNFVGDIATTTFAPVAARTTQLTPISQLPVSPSTLSASQQFARDRAAQQDLLKSVLTQSGAPLSALEQRALQQKIYAGDINAGNINEQILFPLYEQRLQNAYKAVGMGGGVAGQTEYDAYLKNLKEGKIAGTDFENKFLTDIANYSGADKFETDRLASINKAREALKMPLLEKPRDPYANSGFGQFYSSPNFMGGPMYQNQGSSIFNIGSIVNPKKNETPVIKPIDFSKPTTTQLFSGGGPVDKIDEQAQDFSSLSEEDRKRLAMILEQRSLQAARMNLGPVSASLVPSSKEQGQYDAEVAANLYGVQPFADVDLKNKKVNQMGVRYGGESPIGNYEIQYAVDPETRQPVISGAVRKQLSPSSSLSAQGTYVPVKDYKDYYNVGVNYVKEFDKGGHVKKDKFDAEILAGTYLSPDYYAEADKDMFVERASGKMLKDFDKRIADQSRGTNVSADPSRYIRENTPVFPFKESLNAAGWVDPDKPDQVHVWAQPDAEYLAFLKGIKADNPKMQSAFDRIATKRDMNTLVHEMTHSNQLPEPYLSDKEYQRAIRIAKRYADEIGFENPNDKRGYKNPMSGSGLDERELGAYLNAYEGLHPSAKTISGKKALIPFEKTYLGSKVLPPATGLMRLLEDTGALGAFSDLKDPETLKYVNKMMGREKRKPTPKKYEKGGDVKKSGSSKAEPWGEGRESEIIEGNPYGDSSGRPLIKDKGPSAMDVAKFINSFLPVTGDIQSAAEGYQAFKDKDYLGAALGAAGVIPFIPNTTEFIRGIPFEGRKSLEKLLRNEDIPFITVPMNKEDMFSSMKPYDVKNQLDDLAGTNSRSRIFYHAGNAGIGGDTTARNMGGGRDTGHFGTGTYAVTDPKKLPPFYTENRPVSALISRPDENLYIGKTEELDKAHRALRKVNRLADSSKLLPKDKILRALEDFDYYYSLKKSDPELYSMVELVRDARFDLPGSFTSNPEKMIDAANEHIKAKLGAGGSFWKERVQRDSASTRYMKGRGYGGVSTGLAPELDNTTYGSVIYRKKKFSHGGEVTKFIKSKK